MNEDILMIAKANKQMNKCKWLVKEKGTYRLINEMNLCFMRFLHAILK